MNKTMLVLALIGLIAVVEGKVDRDINGDINKLQKKLKSLKPAPEVMGDLIKQLQHQCNSTKHKIDLDLAKLNTISTCVEQHLNESQVFGDIKKAVPEGKLDDVFRDTCKKWPKVKLCLGDLFSIIEGCWDKGNKIQAFVDDSISFLCGESNDGERIALFLAEGGLQCLEQRGDKMRECVSEINDFQEEDVPALFNNLNVSITNNVKKDQICETMQNVVTCSERELRKCNDTTPENVISSMVKFASRSTMGCKLHSEALTTTASASIVNNVFTKMMLLMAVTWTLLF